MTESASIDGAPTAGEATAPGTVSAGGVYRVLARKYRPSDFSTLIGQEALVRTLSNAIARGRIAQAYVLTGVRGVGKTTTARIIARALNCIGPDGTGGPTITPCGVCAHCRAIAEDRHVDVFEMDAASRTGVGDIRELIEGVRYRPTSARYKIYIIDEVHMLSTGAFNALLKTLEEPPEHVKFIFATTEIRKVPVTVLSRCQRFDLRRVPAELLAAHFARIAEREGATVEEGALKVIARAADGSVRDGLSLLDQAIAHAAAGSGAPVVAETAVRGMLGLADRSVVFDLFDALMRGNTAGALGLLDEQYTAGADPVVVLNDLLDLTHWLTRIKVTPEAADDPLIAEAERVRGKDMSARLSVPVLTRAWQMLLKGMGEARAAGTPLQAVEMCLVRLAFAADLPTPAEAIARLQADAQAAPPPAPAGGGGYGGGGPGPGGYGGGGYPPAGPAGGPHGGPGGYHGPTASATLAVVAGGGGSFTQSQALPQRAEPQNAPQSPPGQPAPRTFDDLVRLFRDRKEAVLAVHLERDVHLVAYAPPRLEFRPTKNAPADLANRLARCLGDWTGLRWGITVSNAEGAETLFERTFAGANSHPLIQAVLAAFPKASIGTIRDLPGAPGLPDAATLPLPAADPQGGEADETFYDAYDFLEEEDL